MSNEFKGTKGEWYYDGTSQAIFHPTEIGARMAVVCQTYSTNEYGFTYSTDEYLANAQLIASATTLLDACQTVVDGYETDGMENMHPRDEVFYKYCKDAINKALSINN